METETLKTHTYIISSMKRFVMIHFPVPHYKKKKKKNFLFPTGRREVDAYFRLKAKVCLWTK